MPLPVGSQAPDFSLRSPAVDGLVDVKLSDNFGSKNTVLLFFPAAFTGVCTSEMCVISSGQFLKPDESTAVYGISVDSPFALRAWAQKENISVPLLSDYGRRVTSAYDVELPDFGGTGESASARAAFVIDKGGVIRYAEQTPTTKDLPDFEKVSGVLASLS